MSEWRRRSNRPSGIGLAAVLAVLLVGASAAGLAEPAQPPAIGVVGLSPSAAMAGAADQAEQLRAGLAQDPIAFAKSLSPLEQITLVNSIGSFDTHSAIDIAWFFRTASSAVGGDPSMPIVTFYNPLADAALVTSWRRIDAHWWMTAMVRVSGPVLRGTSGGPWWTQGDSAYAESLQRQAGETLRAAGALTSDHLDALPEASFSGFAAHLFEGERGLAAWSSSPASVAAYIRVRDALAAAKPDQIGLRKSGASASLASELGTVSESVRSSFAAVAAFKRQDGVTVALASPLRPGLLLFVDFDAAASPAPLNVTAVDLAMIAHAGGRA